MPPLMTGAPPIEAYINANVPVYAYIITYILTSLSFCLFLFPPLPLPFFPSRFFHWKGYNGSHGGSGTLPRKERTVEQKVVAMQSVFSSLLKLVETSG